MATPPVVTPAELEQARRDLAGAQDALRELEDEVTELKRQNAVLRDTTDLDEAAERLLSPDEHERFKQLEKRLEDAVRHFDGIVLDALWSARFDGGLALPTWEDEYRNAEADRNVAAGLLRRDSDERILPDDDAESIKSAEAARDRLHRFLAEESSEDFEAWFRREYGFGPGLDRKAVWERLVP